MASALGAMNIAVGKFAYNLSVSSAATSLVIRSEEPVIHELAVKFASVIPWSDTAMRPRMKAEFNAGHGNHSN